jgi:hypothetical protein
MSDDEYRALSLVITHQSLNIATLERRCAAIEAQLAAMRGTQSSERWAGDSPAMTIDPPP